MEQEFNYFDIFMKKQVDGIIFFPYKITEEHIEFLNILQYGLFSYQFFCHKLLRWLVPFLLIGALVCNTILAFSSWLYLLVLIGQLAFYGIGIYGWLTQSLSGIWKIPMFFLVVNFAIVLAWWRYVTGKRVVLWTPSER